MSPWINLPAYDCRGSVGGLPRPHQPSHLSAGFQSGASQTTPASPPECLNQLKTKQSSRHAPGRAFLSMTDSRLEATDHVCGYVCFLSVTPRVRKTPLRPHWAWTSRTLWRSQGERPVSPWRNKEDLGTCARPLFSNLANPFSHCTLPEARE